MPLLQITGYAITFLRFFGKMKGRGINNGLGTKIKIENI